MPFQSSLITKGFATIIGCDRHIVIASSTCNRNACLGQKNILRRWFTKPSFALRYPIELGMTESKKLSVIASSTGNRKACLAQKKILRRWFT